MIINKETIPGSIDKILSDIKSIVSTKVKNNYQLYLFGSRTNGYGHEKSDIDIGILSKNQIPLSIMTEIRDNLENINTLLKIDFVDISTVSKDFRKIAMKSAIQLIP